MHAHFGVQGYFCHLNLHAKGCMHQKILMIPVVLASLAVLMSEAQSFEPLDPANSARVRVFQQADTTLYPG